MQDQKVLGKRIRAFRKRAGFSQMDLEIEIEASPGSLSRIENGEVNPTKETVYKLADHLNLSNQERQYLYGSWFNPATTEEVGKAIQDTEALLEKKGILAYILDERFRMVAVSRGFQKLFGYSNSQIESILMQPFISILAEDKFGILKFLSEGAFDDVIFNLLTSFYSDCGFMDDDEIVNKQIESIKNNPRMFNLWEKVLEHPIRKYNDHETRRVVLKLAGIDFVSNYLREPLYRNRRFEIVEYIPEQKFARFIAKLIL